MKNIYIICCFIFLGNAVQGQICVGTPGQITWQCWQGLFEDTFNELNALPDYPRNPKVTKVLYKTQAPDNYAEYMGAKISGFISVPSNQTVTFNLTGNDKARFFLSTGANPATKQLLAYLDDYSEIEEYAKYPSQTSGNVQLLAGVFYYFEIIYADGTGGDHARLRWKTNLVDPLNWNIITAQFLYDVGCAPAPCPPIFTPCDDGNGLTYDDLEDGNCNCVGKPLNIENTCVGARSTVQKYRYDNITGSGFTELYTATKFPGMPDFSESLNFIGHEGRSTENNTGSLVQTFLTVPVTGNYKFLITSDDNAIAFLSSNSDPENKQAHQFLVTGYTFLNEYEKYIYQKTSNLYLEAGKFYYLEINHKGGTGTNHFGLFWQTPFTEAGQWKRISKFYAYDYDCDIACINLGVACNDGNPFTNNDQYDNNCNCIGTPCSGPDCNSPLANYQPHEKCSYSDQMDAVATHNFLSCTKTQNPNPARGTSHWIKYDLGKDHRLLKTQVWNYNVAGQTNQGFTSVIIDYSLDGTTWTQFGSFNWPQATGASNYSGFTGPDFQGLKARYVLITATNASPACQGLGKIAFEAIACPEAGTACNDNNPLTVADQYDANCNCAGVLLNANLCEEVMLSLGDSTLSTNNFSAKQILQSISKIDHFSTVSFYGGEAITLNPGFETKGNSVFWAVIDVCQQQSMRTEKTETILTNSRSTVEPKDQLQISKMEDSGDYVVRFYLAKAGKAKLQVKGQNQKTAITLVDYDFPNSGWYTKIFKSKKLGLGNLEVTLKTQLSALQETTVVAQ